MQIKLVRIFISILLSLWIAMQAVAQDIPFYFRNYQVSNGLSGNAVGEMVQDKKGFMWFASRNGLNRFDGHTFRIFQNITGDSLSIGSNSIFALYEDTSEKLWVGTHKGVYRYDPVADRFDAFKLIPAGEVLEIRGDRNGNIWIISNLQLYRYHLRTGRAARVDLGNDQPVSLHVSPAGAVWVACNNGVVRHYQQDTGRFEAFNVGQLSGVRDIYGAMTLHAVGDSSLLIGSMKKVLLLNVAKKQVRNLTAAGMPGEDVQVHTIFQKSDREFWLGTESGLYILDLVSGKSQHIVRERFNRYSITDNIINSILRDREGGIWITTQFGGINYYSTQFNNFRKFFPKPGNSISGSIVHEITKDRNGHLWVGTEDAGLNRLDIQTGQFKAFLPDGRHGSISYRNLHGMVVDGNELWVGTYEHGLDVIDLRTERVVRHYNASSDPRSLSSNFIVTMYKTREGDILAGTWIGLCKYNRETDDFTRIPFFNSQVQSIHEDAEGTLWVASYGRGVSYYNPKTRRQGHLRYSADRPGGLVDNYVNSIYQSSDKSIWLCTEHGLSRYNPQTGKFRNYRKTNGLPDNQVFRVLEDDAGNFWITTSRGLAKLDGRTDHFTNFHTGNGLPTDQFNYNSSFKDPDGTLYFGTVAGMVGFKPAALLRNAFVPPVYITRLQVNNRDVDIRAEDAPLKRSVIYADELTLPYQSSSLSFDVAVLSYVIPEQNTYQYQLEGLSKEWVPIQDNNRRIQFSKLPPGDYTLKIRGANNDGLWNNRETRLRITILPPFWATGWAYLVYVVLVVSIIVVIFRYYFLALHEKSRRQIETIEMGKEREIYNAKIDFFTNVAHEIRTPLTLIKMPLDKLLASRKSDPETIESLNMIDKNTSRLIDLTNQLLDFRKAEANNYSLNFTKTDINDLLNDVFATFRPAAEQKQLQYKLELPRITLQAFVDEEACKKITSNLVSNAIKYAESSVKVKLSPFNSDDLLFHIEFTNDGPLIGYDDRDRIFEPFYRAEGHSKEQGTGIGLPLARSLAELHKGTLELKRSDLDQNTFLLSIPIHQDYELDLKKEDENSQSAEPDESEQTSANPNKPNVLLVEDNAEILGYLGRELSLDYNIFRAGDGRQAIDLLQEENIHLVISDIMMPVMDGIALCREMKNDVRFSHIPIILLTAKNSISSKIEGLEVGADAYIEKPFSLDHLSAQISNLLHNRDIIKDYFARSPLTHIKGIAFSRADKDFLEQLNAIITVHIADSDLDVDMLSSKMNMSRPTLYRKIKGISDMTPNELINLSRLKKAAELLAEKNYKINEVADMVGYSVPTNFSRDFQKQFGVSPSGYVNTL
ncbi:two-component regulator propeller domain-containing protein [Dyadobacter fermentans]|uniref:histidine kinase n=1 Tax=Dyadobacter fermentans (strain ATCC 700827 / DSM 18053 / CIP 107007 / KCTC 52180 / NS114) TaxID=471854 RepID=C6W090_DYAFD|nr:two-component regulator propeller domain-containing protein [Dyadobacter fermentans]ACT91824.1 histidine kinase [Dyadobacter fermentans DSM 18053]